MWTLHFNHCELKSARHGVNKILIDSEVFFFHTGKFLDTLV